jgi:hypothetical protein
MISRHRQYLVAVTFGLMTSVAFLEPLLAHGVKSKGALDPVKIEQAPSWFIDLLVKNAEATARFRLSEKDGYRYIEADGLPNHQTGSFPNRRNPNAIRPQNYSLRVPLVPRKSSQVTVINHQVYGIALNGVQFDPNTAEYWNNDRSSGWNLDALYWDTDLGLDESNAHVQPDGSYHYHGIPTGLLEKFPYKEKPILIGYAADGFPIYGPYGYKNPTDTNSGLITLRPSYKLKSGARAGNGPGGAYSGKYVQDFEYVEGSGDLDQCNGRFAATPENPDGEYHYSITTKFPFISRCLTGVPDSSFERRRPPMGAGENASRRQSPEGHQRPRSGGQMGSQEGGQRRGPPDLREAAKKLGVSFEKLRRALGPPPPNFNRASKELGISVEDLRKVLPGPPG